MAMTAVHRLFCASSTDDNSGTGNSFSRTWAILDADPSNKRCLAVPESFSISSRHCVRAALGHGEIHF